MSLSLTLSVVAQYKHFKVFASALYAFIWQFLVYVTPQKQVIWPYPRQMSILSVKLIAPKPLSYPPETKYIYDLCDIRDLENEGHIPKINRYSAGLWECYQE